MFSAHTFDPGWDKNANAVGEFTDVREFQRQLKAGGEILASEADEGTIGPASLMALDPDGNTNLVDQHVQQLAVADEQAVRRQSRRLSRT